MPRAVPRFEEIAGQRLPLGGKNGYIGVRGKQGRKKDKFQGVTPRKQHRTDLFDSPLHRHPRLEHIGDGDGAGGADVVVSQVEVGEHRNAELEGFADCLPSTSSDAAVV